MVKWDKIKCQESTVEDLSLLVYELDVSWCVGAFFFFRAVLNASYPDSCSSEGLKPRKLDQCSHD